MKDPKTYRPHDYEMMEAIEGKAVKDIGPGIRPLIDDMFHYPAEDSIVHCELCDNYEKPDVKISIGEECHYVSLKSGRSKSVHYEGTKSFILFLREQGVSKESQKTLLRYFYGDGTMTGEGETRLSAHELRKMMEPQLEAVNAELDNRKLLRACVRRFVFDGTEKRSTKADYIAFGNPTLYIYASRQEIEDFVLRRRFGQTVVPHIGPLFFTPWVRNVHRKPSDEWKRHFVHVCWPFLLTDIEKIQQAREEEARRLSAEEEAMQTLS